jgi:hypothetical protein
MSASKNLRIGVDVGGTNTDGAIIDPSRIREPDKGILAYHKTATTPDPSDGINAAIASLLASAAVDPGQVASVTIGTTHFVNAVVERDGSRLAKVAVLRLCGPFSKHVPPCVDWPDDVRVLVLGHYALLSGGLEVDGSPIGDVDEEEVRREWRAHPRQGHPQRRRQRRVQPDRHGLAAGGARRRDRQGGDTRLRRRVQQGGGQPRLPRARERGDTQRVDPGVRAADDQVVPGACEAAGPGVSRADCAE